MRKTFSTLLCIAFLSSAAQAIPLPESSRYFPRYTHTTTGGTPSITTNGHTAIYIRQGGHIYNLVPMSGGRFWARQAWESLETRIEESHASFIVDVPADADPVTLIINGRTVSFDSFTQLNGHKGQIPTVGGLLLQHVFKRWSIQFQRCRY